MSPNLNIKILKISLSKRLLQMKNREKLFQLNKLWTFTFSLSYNTLRPVSICPVNESTKLPLHSNFKRVESGRNRPQFLSLLLNPFFNAPKNLQSFDFPNSLGKHFFINWTINSFCVQNNWASWPVNLESISGKNL